MFYKNSCSNKRYCLPDQMKFCSGNCLTCHTGSTLHASRTCDSWSNISFQWASWNLLNFHFSCLLLPPCSVLRGSTCMNRAMGIYSFNFPSALQALAWSADGKVNVDLFVWYLLTVSTLLSSLTVIALANHIMT